MGHRADSRNGKGDGWWVVVGRSAKDWRGELTTPLKPKDGLNGAPGGWHIIIIGIARLAELSPYGARAREG